MRSKKLLSLLLVLSMVAGLSVQSSAATIKETKKKAAQLEQEQETAKEELKALKKKLNTLADEMDDIEGQIDDKEDEIADTEEKLTQAKVDEHSQYKSMKLRIKYMYETGDAELINIIFESQSMSDFLNNIDYVNTLESYDREQLVKYQNTVQKVKKQEKQLKSEYEKLEEMQDKLIAKEDEVKELLADKADEIEDLDEKLASTNATLKKLEEAAAEAARKKAEAAAAAKAAAEAAAQQAAASEQSNQEESESTDNDSSDSSDSGSGTGTGQFTHPCPSGTISSTFGYRDNPTGSGTAYHKGIDFAASTGTPIYAADSGTVVIAGYSVSAGNWIVIDHGNGLQTEYMHASALYVSAGQTVSKGQTIAAVGTTGDSTGPHLHFQVMLNNNPVDPAGYL